MVSLTVSRSLWCVEQIENESTLGSHEGVFLPEYYTLDQILGVNSFHFSDLMLECLCRRTVLICIIPWLISESAIIIILYMQEILTKFCANLCNSLHKLSVSVNCHPHSYLWLIVSIITAYCPEQSIMTSCTTYCPAWISISLLYRGWVVQFTHTEYFADNTPYHTHFSTYLLVWEA